MKRPFSLLLPVVSAVAAGALFAGCGGDRPADWTYISAVLFQPACATASCHSRGAAVAGLDFSDPDRGYTSLTALTVWIPEPAGTIGEGCRPVGGRIFCAHPRPMVIAHDPGQSRLVHMLRGRGAPRMPPDRPLAGVDIRLVERWILDGARRSPDGPPAGAPPPRTDAGAPAARDAGGDAGTDGAGGGVEDGGGYP